MKPQLTEDELLDLVNDEIECEAGDDGIGSYEFWGHRGTDRRPYVEVVTESVTVDVTDYAHEDEEDLPTAVRGSASHGDETCAYTLYFRTLAEKDGRVLAVYAVDAE